MWTAAFVFGAVLVVAAQLAVATINYDGSGISDRAVQIEERLDRELHEWVYRSFALPLRADAARTAARPETAGSSG